MDDYLYYVDTARGTKQCFYKFDDALEYYESNNGIDCVAKTKELFPTFYTIIDQPAVDIERIRKDWTMKKTTQAQRKAIDKYDKANTKQICLKLNLNTDEDILNYLESMENKQGFIKELIRKEMNKNLH